MTTTIKTKLLENIVKTGYNSHKNRINWKLKMAHKVFVSFHHGNDQKTANYLRTFYGNADTLIDRSLQDAYDNRTNDEIWH